MKPALFAAAIAVLMLPGISAADTAAHTENQLRRAVGSCLITQAVILDTASQPIEIMSRAIVAGCHPVIAEHQVRLGRTGPGDLARALTGKADTTDAIFGVDAVLTERAASVVEWLRTFDNAAMLRMHATHLAPR